MKTTQLLFIYIQTFLVFAVSLNCYSQTQFCGDNVPAGWVTVSISGTCGDGSTNRMIVQESSMAPGSTLRICGDPAPNGWVTTNVVGTCPSNGINYVSRDIIKVAGYTGVSEMNICGDPAPPGWITKYVNGYCATVNDVTYESRTITRINDLPNGTEIGTCGDLPPAGWVTKTVNSMCPANGINYMYRTIKRIDGMAAGAVEEICGDLPPTGWITIEVNSNCGYGSNYIYRKIKKIEGLPSETEIETCGDLPPLGWVTLTASSNCGLNSAYVFRKIKKITCMPVGTTLDICGDEAIPEGWSYQPMGTCGLGFTARRIYKFTGYPTDPPITISGPSNTTICSGQSVTLSASNCSWGFISWSTGAQGASITVYPNTTTSYTATCSQGECSNTSNTIMITVASPDVQVPSNASTCSGNSATLTASGCNGNYQWFTSNTSNSPVAYGSTYTTPPLNNNTIYYVNCKIGDCESAKKSIFVTISGSTNPPNSTGQTICAGKTATLTATGCSGGTYKWYSSNSSTTILASTASYTTPALNNTTIYYVSCTISSCESSRKATTATIGPPPAAPTASASGTAICNGQSVTLTATGCSGTVTWTNGQSGSSISVGTTGTYAAKCTVNTCISGNSNVLTITSGNSGAPDNLTLSGTATAGLKAANKTITSTQVIPNGVNTTYNAGNNITLNPPFSANNGSTFKVEIKGCS